MIRLVRLLVADKAAEIANDIVTYNVVPTARQRGFVQFVPNSQTVAEIMQYASSQRL